MTRQDKRTPAFTDLDLMPFGKHKGTPMQDVPPRYLQWLRNSMEADRNILRDDAQKVYNYIFNSWEAIQQELGER